jgi:hypothetical protein
MLSPAAPAPSASIRPGSPTFTLTTREGRMIPLEQIGRTEVRMEEPLMKRRDRTPHDHRAERHRREAATSGRHRRDPEGPAADRGQPPRRLSHRDGRADRGVGAKANAALAKIFLIMVGRGCRPSPISRGDDLQPPRACASLGCSARSFGARRRFGRKAGDFGHKSDARMLRWRIDRRSTVSRIPAAPPVSRVGTGRPAQLSCSPRRSVSVIGRSRYCSSVRSPVTIITSAGMPAVRVTPAGTVARSTATWAR